MIDKSVTKLYDGLKVTEIKHRAVARLWERVRIDLAQADYFYEQTEQQVLQDLGFNERDANIIVEMANENVAIKLTKKVEKVVEPYKHKDEVVGDFKDDLSDVEDDFE